MQLRDFQSDVDAAIVREWERGARNVLSVLPTGAGKTVIFSHRIAREEGPAVAIAHRQELVFQISCALAAWGVRHRIVGPKSVVKLCVWGHMQTQGASFYDPGSKKAVAGVDTLIRRKDDLGAWARSVRLVVMDEGHHVLRANKWGAAFELFPNARGLMVTATPERADNKGIHVEADGIVESMIVGPSTADLIEWGYLAPYRLFAPPSKVDMSDVTVGKDGDFNRKKTAVAVRRAQVVGDVVEHFDRTVPAAGRGITFLPDVDTASEQTARFNAAGIRAEMVSAKTPDRVRQDILRRFAAGELRNLPNVDLFGEGFDVPAIDAVSLARPTQSLAVFMQQCGRALRPMYAQGLPIDAPEQRREAIAAGPKPHAIIIDHVANHERHGLPHARRDWNIYGRNTNSRGPASDVVPTRSCLECLIVYERVYSRCPSCGAAPQPASRAAPEFVDGDLCEIDTGILDNMRRAVERVDGSASVGHLYGLAAAGARKQHRARQTAQDKLREAMALWAGCREALGDSESSVIQRRFYLTFGVDILSAQALGRPDAEQLFGRVWADIISLARAHNLDVSNYTQGAA